MQRLYAAIVVVAPPSRFHAVGVLVWTKVDGLDEMDEKLFDHKGHRHGSQANRRRRVEDRPGTDQRLQGFPILEVARHPLLWFQNGRELPPMYRLPRKAVAAAAGA